MAFPPAMMHAPVYPPYCDPSGYPGPPTYYAPIYHAGAPLVRVPSHHAAPASRPAAYAPQPAAYLPRSAAYPSQSAAYLSQAPHPPPQPRYDGANQPRYDSANPFGNPTCRQYCRTAGTHELSPQDINASPSARTRQDALTALPSSAMPHGYPRVRCEIPMGDSWASKSGSPSRAPTLAGYTARCGLAGVSGRHTVNFYDVDQIAGALVRAAGSKLSADDRRPQTFVARVLGRAQVQLSVALHALLLLRARSSMFVLASVSPEQRLLAALSLAHRAGTEVGICTGCWAHIGNYCWAGEGRAWLGADAFVDGVAPFSKEAMRKHTEGLLRAIGFSVHVERAELENVALEILRSRTPEATSGRSSESRTPSVADGERNPRARLPPTYAELADRPQTAAAGARRARHGHSSSHPRPHASTDHLVYAPSVYDDAGHEPNYDGYVHTYPPSTSSSDSRSRTLSLGAGARMLSAAAQQRVGAFHHRPSPLVVYGASGYLA
ncbi:uncharacterized protein SCHCODRAFT_02642514 [Schizophyllum commune H4-8]|nr:uncharacterized protein SCHCODRAFT_02642514 [Schizophyllum commune H4-8]KAI5885784.1 hypothetical protein SCHCODRAFT_02642514 [Schizophyllum commune H4-8]